MPTKPASGTALDSANSIATACIACWPLWENTGTVANDIVGSGKKFNLTLNGTNGDGWVSTPYGPGLFLSTTSGFGTGSGYTSGFLDGTSEDSILLLVKPTGSSSSPNRFFERGANDDFRVTVSSGGVVTYDESFSPVSSTSAINNNAWHTIVITTKSGDFNRLYFDGSLQGGPTALASGITRPIGKNLFLNQYGGGGFRCDATYAFAAIFSRALTSTEVTTLTTNPFSIFVQAGGLRRPRFNSNSIGGF